MTRKRLVVAGSVLAVVVGGSATWGVAQAGEQSAGSWRAEPTNVTGSNGQVNAGKPSEDRVGRATAAVEGPAGVSTAAPATEASQPHSAGDGRATVTDDAAPAALPAPVPLLHLVNDDGISLYTLSSSEAANAVARHGFKRLPNHLGYMRAVAFPGSKPVHRLTKVGGGGWLLTPSTEEREQLVESGKFKDEGVLGYVAQRPAPGSVLLSRYRGSRDWRVELAEPHGKPQAMLAASYKLDGPVGYIYLTPGR